MTLIGRLFGVCSALVMTCSMLSCADGTKQSPLAPSQTAVVARATETFDAGVVDLDETAALADDISAAVGKPGSIQITVKDKNAAAKSATVTVTCPGGFTKTGKTSAAGKVTITGVPAGLKCQVKVAQTNYSEQSKAITAKSSQTVAVSFAITKKPTPLPTCSWLALTKVCKDAFPKDNIDDLSKNNACLTRAYDYYLKGCVGTFKP